MTPPSWERLARAETHPLRIALLEEIEASKVPLSATSLREQHQDYSLGVCSYHVQELAKAGFIEFTHSKPRRGALEKFHRAVAS